MNDNGLTGIGAEVGVMCGTFSKEILKVWKGKTLFMVDSWRQRDDYPEIANVPNEVHLDALVKTYAVTNHYGDRAAILKMSSLAAAERFKVGELDFVYIDANHNYGAVIRDITTWAPKVRGGGIIAGHDYFKDDQLWGKCGVKKAVDYLFLKDEINVIEESDPTWWVIK
jgi:hypothetical protein